MPNTDNIVELAPVAKNGDAIHLAPPARAKVTPLLAPQSPQEAERRNALVQNLKHAAAQDNHTVIAPTHVVTKGGQIVGYGSLGGMPTLHVWLDSKQVHAVESLRLLETIEAVAASQGVRTVLMPCAEESPFAMHMERMGFTKLGATVLYVKNLNP